MNYIYLCFFFLATIAIHLNTLYLMPMAGRFLKPLLSVGVVLQSLILTTLIGSVGYLLNPYPYLLISFITLTWILLIYYEVNFTFYKCMNESCFSFVRPLTMEGKNIKEVIKGIEIPWFRVVGGFTLVIALGPLFFSFTRYIASSHLVPEGTLFSPLGISFLCLIIFDLMVTKTLSYDEYARYKGALPFGISLFSRQNERIDISLTLQERKKTSQNLSFPPGKKPPIFCFMIESTRESAITPFTTPHLAAFKKENISFPMSFASGNATILARHSVFNGENSLRWSQERNDQIAEEGGSLPLRHLKAMGYQIHLYTASSLVYYNQKKSIFGLQEELIDTAFEPSEKLPVHQRDSLVMEKLIQDLSIYGTDGHLFIVFLDSPHFAYSWPDKTRKHQFNLYRMVHTTWEKQKLIHAYHQAIKHVDHLLGQFFKAPKPKNSVIVVTSDHGEEFYETGNITHFSNLSHYQTRVPIYLRFGEETSLLKDKSSSIACHADIFPTIFDYLGESLLADGESIFKEDRWPYVITSHRNGVLSPRMFCINDLNHKMVVRSNSWKGWTASSNCYFSALFNQQDQVVHSKEVRKKMENALKDIFK